MNFYSHFILLNTTIWQSELEISYYTKITDVCKRNDKIEQLYNKSIDSNIFSDNNFLLIFFGAKLPPQEHATDDDDETENQGNSMFVPVGLQSDFCYNFAFCVGRWAKECDG